MTSQWPKRHALAAPWGTALATWILTMYYEPVAFYAMVSMGAMAYGMIMSALELGVMMAFYAYEKIKNEREKLRKQGADSVLTRLAENPRLSDEMKKALIADLQNNGRNNGNMGN
ncbi:MAG: hypothetical protein F4Z35_07935 [Dehalococcoidia bacterium]|nr:hypothetical protein [Dehalococcoidia bacterium]